MIEFILAALLVLWLVPQLIMLMFAPFALLRLKQEERASLRTQTPDYKISPLTAQITKAGRKLERV